MVNKEERFFKLATVGGLSEDEAYKKAYSTSSRKSLLTQLGKKRKRDPELFKKIAEYKSRLFESAKSVQENEIAKIAKEAVLSSIEKRQFLKQMIAGKLEMEEILISGTKTKKIKRKPTNLEKLRALQLDNLMAGHNAPTGLRHEAGDSFIDFMKQTYVIKNKNIPNELSR